MMQTIETNWVAFAVALLAILIVGWLLLRRASKAPPRREYKPDVLDQGAASVHRNQALIDAAPAAQIVPPPMGAAMAGVAEAVAIGAQDVVEEVEAATPPPPPEVPTPPPVEPETVPAPSVPEAPPASPEPETQPVAPPEYIPGPEAATQPEPQVPEPEPAPEQPEGDPVPHQTPTPEPPPSQPENPGGSTGDDLSRIKGLGPKLQALLPTLGLTTYAQIAALSDADLAELDGKLGAFAGRPAKDNWVSQARYLAEGDVAGFEAQFGKV